MSPQHWVGAAVRYPGQKEAMALVEAEEVLRYTARFVGKDEQAAVDRARQYARTMRPIEAYARARHELVVRAGFEHGDSGDLLDLARREVALRVAWRVFTHRVTEALVPAILAVDVVLRRTARMNPLDLLAFVLAGVVGLGWLAIGAYVTFVAPDSVALILVTWPVGVALLLIAADVWRNP